jgi:sugar transferase (PEP-CTERM/EpsH1 system associated)
MLRKLLFVAARPPWPLDTGAKIRSWHILSGLVDKFRVDVLVYQDESEEEAWLKEGLKLGVNNIVSVQNLALNQPLSTGKVIASLLRGIPANIPKYQAAAFSARFIEMLAEDYDVIHIEHVHMAGVLQNIKRTGYKKKIISLDAHNVEWQIAKRMGENEISLPYKLALKWQARNMFRFEEWVFRSVDTVMAVSEEDAEVISAMTDQQTPVALVENGVDEKYFIPGTESDVISGRIVFVGSMDWQPNIDGMLWFVREILPRIKNTKPLCSLVIVGRKPHKCIQSLHSPEEGVVVTGSVDDVRPYVRSAEVVVAPLRYGGGTRLKILEAFAMGKAVVSTTLGCEGIDCRDEEHLQVRNTPAHFAGAVVELMADPSLRARIGSSGCKLAHERYTWSAIQQKMLRIYG